MSTSRLALQVLASYIPVVGRSGCSPLDSANSPFDPLVLADLGRYRLERFILPSGADDQALTLAAAASSIHLLAAAGIGVRLASGETLLTPLRYYGWQCGASDEGAHGTSILLTNGTGSAVEVLALIVEQRS